MKHKVRQITGSRIIAKNVQTEPPIPVSSLFADSDEKSKADVVNSQILFVMEHGDPEGKVLRMANYVIETSKLIFSERESEEAMILRTVAIIKAYDDPAGAALLKRVVELYGNRTDIGKAALRAFAEIAGPGEADYLSLNDTVGNCKEIYLLRQG